jgi:hypothetical protein
VYPAGGRVRRGPGVPLARHGYDPRWGPSSLLRLGNPDGRRERLGLPRGHGLESLLPGEERRLLTFDARLPLAQCSFHLREPALALVLLLALPLKPLGFTPVSRGLCVPPLLPGGYLGLELTLTLFQLSFLALKGSLALPQSGFPAVTVTKPLPDSRLSPCHRPFPLAEGGFPALDLLLPFADPGFLSPNFGFLLAQLRGTALGLSP